MKRILIINHHDSFVHNLVQIIRETPDCTYTFVDTEALADRFAELISTHEYILLSPGPGHPEEFTQLIPTIQKCFTTHSIMGVCLGMQAIALAFGGQLLCLPSPKHGHKSTLQDVNTNAKLFKGLIQPIEVARYHSWVVSEESLPKGLTVDAYDEDGNIAALSHSEYNIRGVQFHPESIITKQGRQMITNWLK
ncbi:aminodeoxychorismate/anthranilate synthase component II [Porphyromonas sp.]|uniref:anthranilate synthase component II n=1 Tax=Porphyromonas sp. TaxID=1924944 RepID=UPI0026DC592B|nr:aminodeoxychorismate/anthranilate synthase component II [Porphyromonas sp.]MDO4695316.1 aminodeoxychorismate/anthranilate synthase component II [Porphyromonas sp.]MDO4771021.1 aminodeoxychorismate/anthranilate synthase component II [Porphyromonas sp.]